MFAGFLRKAAVIATRSDDEQMCVLCGRARRDVKLLLAGTHGAACDDCITFSVAVLDTQPVKPMKEGEAAPRFATSYLMIRTLLRELGPRAAYADSDAAVGAGVALAQGYAPWLRALANDAATARNSRAALAALAAVAQADVGDGDRVNRAFHLCKLGRHDEALASVDGVVEERADAVDLAIANINRAAALLGDDERVPDLGKAESALDWAETHLARCVRFEGQTDPAVYRVPIAISRAEIALHRGDAKHALAILRALRREDVDGRLLGDVVDVVEGRAAARAVWQRALDEEAHPESLLAARLRGRLTR